MNLDNQLTNLDNTDKVILKGLAENSRASFTTIAKDVDVAAGTIHVREKKLMDAGIIKKHTLEIDFKEIGYEITCFFGITYDFKKALEEDFKEEIKKNYPNILELYSVSGKYKFYGKAMALNLSSLNKVFDEIRAKEGVIEIDEFVCMENHFCDSNRLIEIVCKEDDIKNSQSTTQINFLKKEILSKESRITQLKLKHQTKSIDKEIEKIEAEIKEINSKILKLEKD